MLPSKKGVFNLIRTRVVIQVDRINANEWKAVYELRNLRENNYWRLVVDLSFNNLFGVSTPIWIKISSTTISVCDFTHSDIY